MTARQITFALCAVLFAVVGLSGLIVFGDPLVRKLAIAAALVGCLSQFVGQGTSVLEERLSLGISYAGFLVACVALILL